MYPLEKIQSILEKNGFIGEIIGQTPDNDSFNRFNEIQKWLNDFSNLDIKSFVILDDCKSMGHLSDYFVQTTWEEGLTQKHIDKTINILNKKGD